MKRIYTPPENGELVSCGGSTFTISTVGTLIIDGKSTLSDLSWHMPLMDENIQETSKLYLHFSFSIPGNDFGGGWCLIPYELRFIRRQDNDLDDLILFINSDRRVLYKRKCDHPVFTPPESTPKSLRDNLNVTTYEYSGNKLANIFYANANTVSFEYSGDKIVNINGLSNMVYLDYDEKNFLCKIFDDQSFANFSYEDNKFDKVTDEAGTIVDFRHPTLNQSQIEEKVPLIFNGNGEVFYYRNAQNIWKFSYRWLDSDENAEEERMESL